MARVEASYSEVFVVQQPVSEVFQCLLELETLARLTPSVETFEVLGERIARYVLEARSDGGDTFQPDYTLVYADNGADAVSWHAVSGNMGIQGTIQLTPHSLGATECRYFETIAPELPITKLTAAIFKPLVARELRKDIGRFVANLKRHFGDYGLHAAAHAPA
jgi:uncharacterized membrane protein